eukprot:9379841-Alexandrium_andersonii.AAC.1
MSPFDVCVYALRGARRPWQRSCHNKLRQVDFGHLQALSCVLATGPRGASIHEVHPTAQQRVR